MPQLTIFYSWQSDRPTNISRGFIGRALAQAAERLERRHGWRVVIDSDTQGVPGTPPVSDTILKKIAACDIFLADMTFVATTEGGKHTPNPNVMVEYGYALREKGASNIVLAMNTHFGPADALPFDLRHLRHPLAYDVGPEAPDALRRKARDAFSARLETALDAILEAHAIAPAQVSPDLRQRLLDMAVATQNARVANDPPVVVSSPQAAIFMVPEAALESPRLSLQAVANARHLLIPSVDVRAEEGQDQRQWWACGIPRRVSNRINHEATWSSRLLRPGVIEHYIMLGQRIDDDRDILVDGRQVEGAMVKRLDRSLEMFDALGLEGPTLVAVALYGLEDVRWASARSAGRFRTHSLGFEALIIPKGVQSSAAQLRPLLDDLWLAGGRPEGSPSYGVEGQWAGYERPDLYGDL